MTQHDEWKIEKPMAAYMAGFEAGTRWRLADVKPRPPPCPYHPASESAIQWLFGFGDGEFDE